MKLTNLFLSALLAFSAVPFLASAQPVVSNVTFNQEPGGAGATQVVVNYDLVSDDAPSTVSLLYSLDALPFEFATAVSGDVGGGIDTGTDKEILWSVAQDLPSTESTNLVVRVLAEDGLPIELEISATVADGGLTNDPNQTATFTFSEAVTGFTADDVTVTNATKGAFDGSGAVYTLDITADGDGTVSVSVPAAAGVSASGSGNSTLAAGTYSFEVDTTAPTIASIDPADEATINSLDDIVVTFTEDIINLTAGQLTVNGSPADTVTGSNPYTFSGFDTPALGTVNVVLAAGSTTDLAGNAFAGDAWSYEAESLSLTITSTLAEDSISETQNQTLTFTFGDDVSGFDEDQVSVTNATKGAFSGSGSVYTLELTGEGGLIEVEVPANVGSSFTAPASFSNFYQDTWTIELQESPLVTMDLIRIPAGTFTMGSPETELSHILNETQHQVTISQDFYLGKTQVTQEQWLAIYGSFPMVQAHGTDDNLAVHRVSHDDIMEPTTGFMQLLNDHITATSQGPATATLPTEAQWEYACRAGTTTRFNFGDGLSTDESCATGGGREDNMWYCGNNSPIGTKLVGQFPANAWGLHDMHGNVSEWCTDWYNATYPTGPVTDPTGPATGSSRVVRGGNWGFLARFCRSAQREFIAPSIRNEFVGFRVLAARPMPLTITSTETEPVHQTETQTLTFTFDEAVTGFDVSDVTLTGATAGTFTEVSPSVYTLEITGTGGTITASVAANAATENTSTWVGTTAATFSNFYQDTWTLDLPGAVPMELIRIPAGTFTMGSPSGETSRISDETQHTVTLTQDFYLGKTEVTQQQWTAIAAFTGLQAQSFVGNTMPVHNVTWDEIQTWLTALDTAITEPGTFSLPTESQWEYAARAGTTTRFNYGDGFASNETSDTAGGRGDNMWFTGNNSPNGTKAVGQKPANAWGLRDMHGNVWEWCSDWYGTYPGTVTDPTGPGSGSFRVFRGGSWDSDAQNCRSARRNIDDPTSRGNDLGFRVMAVRPMPLTITSNETEAVHQTENQTLTFTFDGPVSDFTADDVNLTSATKGTFTEFSPSVYTLEITGTGGTIDVSVAPASPATAPATFSNFYQDTWTIELQESPLVTMELIRIPGGTFTMGSPETELSRNTNETQHEVTISQDFYLGKTQVTQAQWLAIEGSWPGTAPSATFGVGDDYPAYNVSHNDIQTFLTNLNTTITEPGTFALPTESQWEYACRAGTTTRFNFGDGLSTDENCATGGGREDNMWYCGNNSPSGTKLVGQFSANAWGLHDMHGNVWEWCADWFGTYPTGPVTDPTGPATGSNRVVRGGSWFNNAWYCRSARRLSFSPARVIL